MKTLRVIRKFKVVAEGGSFYELLNNLCKSDRGGGDSYMELATIKDYVEHLKEFGDPCECEDGESCYICQDWGENNMIFCENYENKEPEFFKVPDEILGDKDLMAEWILRNRPLTTYDVVDEELF